MSICVFCAAAPATVGHNKIKELVRCAECKTRATELLSQSFAQQQPVNVNGGGGGGGVGPMMIPLNKFPAEILLTILC